MPPKKVGKKAAKKKVEKQIEDKTFGLKNKKKSKKVQQFVAQVEKMATDGGPRRKRETLEDKAAAELRARKKAKKEAEKEMAMLLGAEVAMKKKKKKKTEGEGEEEADSGAGGEFKSAAEMAKEEMGAALEAAADVPPASMVEVTLDGTMEVGEHAIESVEDEIERKRAALLARLPRAKLVAATPEQLTAFKRKRDAQRAKEQKLADQEIYGKGGRKGLSGREVTLRKLKESGGLDDHHDTEGDGAGAEESGAGAAAAAAASSAAGAAAAAAATVDADVFLQGDDDDEDLDALDDSDDAGDGDDGEEGEDARGAKAAAAAE
ncbi:hypothetical protein FNF27_02617 [Cafeteria roenbergensis]|uniref:Uncharacterized protein n=1 Tax=Cafeteria roenbergensis TaxID=33653 RepID=A0A5A8CCL0_CAFRO|nr:hypothetical protein FNF29_05203 [Cafeteria roenbergensis]KAA0160400.1 hypothetical protein FNF28_05479 [Cafeteria roenbergensis]KAA0160615.1 hypothetical protein FNF31_04166 [Cafeteria roenbergensis]KAA0175896.1 hypothetical protein FNF27_02617 [Cafeteria roenbergensis]|eukprot:KAA0150628.1 hypothetical protein FNF29_05203 [Cafeteria roenbergensis]